MIISRGNLQVVLVTKDDRQIPVLDTVYIAGDGSTIGSNGRAMIAVGPVAKKVRDSVPLEEGLFPDGGIVLPTGMVKDILRSMPRDREFGGLLEHISVQASSEGPEVELTVTDGKRTRRLKGRRFNRPYLNYMEIFKEAFGRQKDHIRTALNLKRLLSVLNVINKICEDQAGELPVYLEFSSEGDIIIRATDLRTAQDIVVVMTAYHGIEGVWKPMTLWERLLSVGKTIAKKTTCAKRKK